VQPKTQLREALIQALHQQQDRHRRRLYATIKERGTLGCTQQYIGVDHLAITQSALAELLADGWITEHECYGGDGQFWNLVYVANNTGRGTRP
jgi:hypothetical protein